MKAAATAKEHDGDKTKETAAPAKSLFGALLEKLEVMNPTQFKLPKNIRRSFLGYARHPETGDFLDLTENKLAKAAKPNPETFESTTAICFKCCSLGTIPKIIQCDFCDLWWHLDCLNPPLAHPPNLSVVPIDVDVEQPETSDGTPRQGATIPTGNRQRDEDEQATQLLSSGLPLGMRKKWMCPCHADLHVPARRRKAWGENVVDVPVAAEVADGADPASWNEGNIEVVVDAPNPKLGVRGEFDSAEKIGAAIIPGAGLAQFLETGGVQDRDGSPEPEERRAPVLKPTPTVDVVRFDTNEEYQSMAFEDVIYRVPEKRIKLDFIRQLRHLSRKRQAAREEQEQAGWQSEFYGADITDGLMTLARAALGDSVSKIPSPRKTWIVDALPPLKNGKDAMEIDESTVSTTPPAEVSVSDNMPEVIRKGDALYEEFMAWKRSAVATTGST